MFLDHRHPALRIFRLQRLQNFVMFLQKIVHVIVIGLASHLKLFRIILITGQNLRQQSVVRCFVDQFVKMSILLRSLFVFFLISLLSNYERDFSKPCTQSDFRKISKNTIELIVHVIGYAQNTTLIL